MLADADASNGLRSLTRMQSIEQDPCPPYAGLSSLRKIEVTILLSQF